MKVPSTRFTRRLPKPGTRSNGLLGDINLAFRCGWYITPWGYLLIHKVRAEIFQAWLISYNAEQMVSRYNNRMGTEQATDEMPHSWRLTRSKGAATNRGWK